MELQTKVEIAFPDFHVGYQSRLLLVGSCFVENIGEKLKYFKFDADINPCGIVYNPLSVAHVLDLLLEERAFTEKDLLWNNGTWVSLSHHGSFSSPQKEACIKNINQRIAYSSKQLKQADLLVITFGTSWVYRYRDTGEIVSNCHKFPASVFERFRLTPSDIVKVYEDLIQRLRKVNPMLPILFTVSPVRHWKDGAHGNQLSKAVLLLAIDEIISRIEKTYYFPAYELVMDELRDYRFYAEDMLHVSPVTAGYIWQKFREAYIHPSSDELMQRIEKVNKILQHRPLNPDSETYRTLLEKTYQEVGAIEQEIIKIRS